MHRRHKENVDLSDYSQKLQKYSLQELEDIYFHIDILNQPVEYGMLTREIEARKLQQDAPPEPPKIGNVRRWLSKYPFIANNASLSNCIVLIVFLFLPCLICFAGLLPIWFLASKLNFLGLQMALCYLLYAPVGPVLGISCGVKLGARKSEVVLPLVGTLLGIYLFVLTHTPQVIYEELTKPTTGGSGGFGGF